MTLRNTRTWNICCKRDYKHKSQYYVHVRMVIKMLNDTIRWDMTICIKVKLPLISICSHMYQLFRRCYFCICSPNVLSCIHYVHYIRTCCNYMGIKLNSEFTNRTTYIPDQPQLHFVMLYLSRIPVEDRGLEHVPVLRADLYQV